MLIICNSDKLCIPIKTWHALKTRGLGVKTEELHGVSVRKFMFLLIS